MSAPDTLKRLIGNWSGENRLWLSQREAVRESETKATVAQAARGKFVTIQYSWADDGHPQEGLLLIGVEEQSDRVHAVWVDSWHMGDIFMLCNGQVNDSGVISVTGSYAAPSGPDWRWRIEIDPGAEPGAGDTFEMIMYNIEPGGQEALAVQASYQRE